MERQQYRQRQEILDDDTDVIERPIPLKPYVVRRKADEHRYQKHDTAGNRTPTSKIDERIGIFPAHARPL
jgi:hypothetical protein